MRFVLLGFRLVTSYLLDCIMRDSSEVAFNLQAELKSAQSELSALREENERLKSESFEELYNAVIDERDALREELAERRENESDLGNECNRLYARMTAAEQRNAELTEVLELLRICASLGADLKRTIDAALKPTESGASNV